MKFEPKSYILDTKVYLLLSLIAFIRFLFKSFSLFDSETVERYSGVSSRCSLVNMSVDPSTFLMTARFMVVSVSLCRWCICLTYFELF